MISTWLKKADRDDGVKPGITSTGAAEFRQANKRIHLLEQEAEVLKRALACVSQAVSREKVSPARKGARR